MSHEGIRGRAGEKDQMARGIVIARVHTAPRMSSVRAPTQWLVMLCLSIWAHAQRQAVALASHDASADRVASSLPPPYEPAAALPHPRGDARTQVDDLYEQHARAVLGYLYHRLPTLADAEDTLADVFIAALRAAAAGETLGIGWLLTVARRRVADYYRDRQRTQVTHALVGSGWASQVGDPRGEPEQTLLRAEERDALLRLVSKLPDDQREALALRFVTGLRSAQIAEVLGKSDEATRALLSRALRRLRRDWEQAEGTER